MAFIDDDSLMDDSVKDDDIQEHTSTFFTKNTCMQNGWGESTTSEDHSSSPKIKDSSVHLPSLNAHNNNNNNNNGGANISGGANVNSGQYMYIV